MWVLRFPVDRPNISGGVSYLPAKPDPYDGVVASAANTWTAIVTAGAVQKAWPSVGAFRSLEVLQRDGNGEWGGRTTSVRVQGSAGASPVGVQLIAGRYREDLLLAAGATIEAAGPRIEACDPA